MVFRQRDDVAVSARHPDCSEVRHGGVAWGGDESCGGIVRRQFSQFEGVTRPCDDQLRPMPSALGEDRGEAGVK